ncbi:MAG: hypothetical protein EKK64_04470 [Neisseriaceae bacterium]|nr:MAG: hypothetical protein EKK64_04470 [Neisseriaceae bacterium]
MKQTTFSKLQTSLSLIQLSMVGIFVALLIDFIPDQDLDSLALLTQFISHLHFTHCISVSVNYEVIKLVLNTLSNYISIINIPLLFSQAKLICTFIVCFIAVLTVFEYIVKTSIISLKATVFNDTLSHSKIEVYKAFIAIP